MIIIKNQRQQAICPFGSWLWNLINKSKSSLRYLELIKLHLASLLFCETFPWFLWNVIPGSWALKRSLKARMSISVYQKLACNFFWIEFMPLFMGFWRDDPPFIPIWAIWFCISQCCFCYDEIVLSSYFSVMDPFLILSTSFSQLFPLRKSLQKSLYLKSPEKNPKKSLELHIHVKSTLSLWFSCFSHKVLL